MQLSMAAVMEASSHRKPASARNSPIQLTLFHFEYFIPVFPTNNTFVYIPESFTISILKAK